EPPGGAGDLLLPVDGPRGSAPRLPGLGGAPPGTGRRGPADGVPPAILRWIDGPLPDRAAPDLQRGRRQPASALPVDAPAAPGVLRGRRLGADRGLPPAAPRALGDPARRGGGLDRPAVPDGLLPRAPDSRGEGAHRIDRGAGATGRALGRGDP